MVSAGPRNRPNLRPNLEGRRGPVYHLDCYRLRSEDEAADLDWETLSRDADALLIEWPERAGAWVPTATRRVTLSHVSDPSRRGFAVE